LHESLAEIHARLAERQAKENRGYYAILQNKL
jgi:hypothetical protein